MPVSRSIARLVLTPIVGYANRWTKSIQCLKFVANLISQVGSTTEVFVTFGGGVIVLSEKGLCRDVNIFVD